MIAHHSRAPENSAAYASAAWQEAFLEMLPRIERLARMAFRNHQQAQREELVAEATANALVAYARLAEQGRSEVASPSSLTRFAVAQVYSGREVGVTLNVRDVLSPHAQRQKKIAVERLHRFDKNEGAWKELLVESKTATPADLAASRIDFPVWLETLGEREREIAEELARGEATGAVSRRFGISPGRISQIRRELRDKWFAFHGEAPPTLAVV
jgi:hypothetical protein